jgi:hypothetical protein
MLVNHWLGRRGTISVREFVWWFKQLVEEIGCQLEEDYVATASHRGELEFG